MTDNGLEQEDFSISAETKSKNSVNLSGGFNKVVLTKVQVEEIGKNEKYTVLSFNFVDLEGIKSYKHTEFIPDNRKPSYEKAKDGFRSRIKHIYETYATFPNEGLAIGAKSWEELYNKIADAFNKNNNGNPVYLLIKDEKKVTIPVWIKNTYNAKGNLQFPLSPNFIERIKEDTQSQPKTLTIDKRYDTIEQPDINATPQMPTFGGAGSDANNFGFD